MDVLDEAESMRNPVQGLTLKKHLDLVLEVAVVVVASVRVNDLDVLLLVLKAILSKLIKLWILHPLQRILPHVLFD